MAERSREQRALVAIQETLRKASNQVLAHAVSRYYSQNEWEEITRIILEQFALGLPANYDFKQILAETTVQDPEGNLNGRAVIDTLRAMADRQTRPGYAAQLQHLANNAEHTLTQLRFLKGAPGHEPKT